LEHVLLYRQLNKARGGGGGDPYTIAIMGPVVTYHDGERRGFTRIFLHHWKRTYFTVEK